MKKCRHFCAFVIKRTSISCSFFEYDSGLAISISNQGNSPSKRSEYLKHHMILLTPGIIVISAFGFALLVLSYSPNYNNTSSHYHLNL